MGLSANSPVPSRARSLVLRFLLPLALGGLAACSQPRASSAGADPSAVAATPAAQAAVGPSVTPAGSSEPPPAEGGDAPAADAAGERAFGAPLVGDAPPVALALLLDDPARYTGQVVRTEGEISAVCQRMGCWMELRDERQRAVRVPMAGHAFFLPRDVAGRRALVEGPLSVRPLGAAEREHLEGEGAAATDVALELSATSVVVRAPLPSPSEADATE
ncbi:MAG: DUF4920 domain-containing protein [Myxococcales bacterium]|nr:DUF4920 domain-containing protein [Myxococcales bacterium]MCB9628513.1 DUF4920 domain-containing protein [Sandaracinaceae bacterium]